MNQFELTNGQYAMVRMLIYKEAKALGYGSKYHEWNHPEWPRRLKQLRIIARKLRDPALNEKVYQMNLLEGGESHVVSDYSGLA